MCLCALCTCMCPQRSRSPESMVSGSCDLPVVIAGEFDPLSSENSLLWSHLYSPKSKP